MGKYRDGQKRGFLLSLEAGLDGEAIISVASSGLERTLRFWGWSSWGAVFGERRDFGSLVFGAIESTSIFPRANDLGYLEIKCINESWKISRYHLEEFDDPAMI